MTNLYFTRLYNTDPSHLSVLVPDRLGVSTLSVR